jgi:hypothetical protein
MDLSSVKNFINDHKAPCAIALAALLVFASLSFARFSQVQSEKAAAEQQTSSEQDDQQAEAEAQLTNEQRSKQGKYSNDVQQVLDVLKANLWCTEDKQKLVTFNQTTFTQSTDDGSSKTVGYVVDAIDTNKEQNTDYTSEVFTIAVETPDDSFILTLTKEDGGDGNFQYFLKSSGLAASGQVYSTVSSNTNIEISTLNQDALQLINNDQEGLEQALRDYSAQYLPATATITWTKSVTIDWENGTVNIPFQFDSTTAQVQVVYDRSAKTFTVQSIR